MTSRSRVALALLAAGLCAGPAWAQSERSEAAAVPREVEPLYVQLKNALDDFEMALTTLKEGKAPVVFGAELLPANANRGPELLRPQTLRGVSVYLDALQALGVRGVTIQVCYPVLLPEFPRSTEYLAFFKSVAAEVRRRGLKLDVENGVLFANSPFSKVSYSYAGLTLQRFAAGKRRMVAEIVRELQPDYLNLGSEPDTEAALTGLKALDTPDGYVELVRGVLKGLERRNTALAAGIGTWGNLEIARGLAARTDLDAIALHVYPVTGQALRNAVVATEIARRHGKRVIVDEAWLYKSRGNETTSIASNAEVFRRDSFSFWAPLDQQFLAGLAAFARSQGVEYVSPFWSELFFGSVDYDEATRRMTYAELKAAVNRVAAANIQARRPNATGEFYRQLASEGPGGRP